MAFRWLEVVCILVVGAFWGCTNPLLRQGSINSTTTAAVEVSSHEDTRRSFMTSLQKFRHVSVWLPYALNQLGSVVFYFTLSNSDISLASPTCNALALAFSVGTSWWWMGETIEHPIRTLVGATLVMGGVGICLYAKGE